MQLIGSLLFNVFLIAVDAGVRDQYCVITPFLSFRGRFWMAGIMTHVVFFALRVLCGIRYTVEGRENLPGR